MVVEVDVEVELVGAVVAWGGLVAGSGLLETAVACLPATVRLGSRDTATIAAAAITAKSATRGQLRRRLAAKIGRSGPPRGGPPPAGR